MNTQNAEAAPVTAAVGVAVGVAAAAAGCCCGEKQQDVGRGT